MAYTVKSQSITNSDATPALLNPPGLGGSALVKNVRDIVALTTAQLGATTTTAAVVRLPTYAKLLEAYVETDAVLDSNGTPTLKIDIGAGYSDAPSDGTSPINQGTSISANALLAAAAFGTSTGTLRLSALGSLAVASRNKPLWAALGLTSDPGGFIDLIVKVNTAAATAVAGNISLDVFYVV